MANQLDDENPEFIRTEGKDIHVVNKQIPIKVGIGSLIFEIILWILIIPGIIFLFCKIGAENYLKRLEQKINHDASQIDNYLEQRVMILTNTAKLVSKAVDLDKEVMLKIAELRSKSYRNFNDGNEMNRLNSQIEHLEQQINLVVERYPNLGAHQEIQYAMQQNAYLQKEITAAREQYNDTVNLWNRAILTWPTKMIIADREGYTTRIPFIASEKIRKTARDLFF